MRDWRGSGSSPGLHNRWGTKTTRGHMLNTTLGVCCNRGDKHEVGAQILNGGAGHQWPPAGDDPGDIVCCVDTELLYIANLRPTHPVAYAEKF